MVTFGDCWVWIICSPLSICPPFSHSEPTVWKISAVVTCCSSSVRRLVCLAYEALREVTTADASPQAAAVMYTAIRDLFELLCDIVPFYHRQRITTAPLHAGILWTLNDKSCIKYSTSKYQYQYQYMRLKYQYQYQWSKYQYKYQYLACKYKSYKYQYWVNSQQ